MIRKCRNSDISRIYYIVNEAAKAYDGAIPADCFHRPYMSMPELEGEMKRMTFYGWEEDGDLTGVMAIEPVKDVTLIRHAYVLTKRQKSGIGSELLKHLLGLVETERLLVGTWRDAGWAVRFYEKHGFKLTADRKTKDDLLRTYWVISERQVETSVVLELEKT
jgi:GNAT superfamily N-acetyltransferase